jgi:hypothetical protein
VRDQGMCVIEKSPIIETPRLTLRAPQTDDAPRIAALCGDYAIAKMTTRMPWPYSRAEADGFVARCQTQDRRKDATFVIDAEDDGVVGVLGLFTPPVGHLEIGYWIGRPYWGRAWRRKPPRAPWPGPGPTGARSWSSPATSPTTQPRARCWSRPASCTRVSSRPSPRSRAASRWIRG